MHSIQKSSCNFNAFGMETWLHIFIRLLGGGNQSSYTPKTHDTLSLNKNNHIAKKTMSQTNSETIHAYPPSNMVVNVWEQ